MNHYDNLNQFDPRKWNGKCTVDYEGVDMYTTKLVDGVSRNTTIDDILKKASLQIPNMKSRSALIITDVVGNVFKDSDKYTAFPEIKCYEKNIDFRTRFKTVNIITEYYGGKPIFISSEVLDNLDEDKHYFMEKIRTLQKRHHYKNLNMIVNEIDDIATINEMDKQLQRSLKIPLAGKNNDVVVMEEESIGCLII